jgi:hypothetical protein
MKFYKIVLPLSMVVVLVSLPEKKAEAQFIVGTVLNSTIGKVIRAIDLQVQRLQNQTIWLQNAQKVVENQLSQLKLTQIAGVSQQQKDLFTGYYNELIAVKSVIANFQQVKEITLKQAQMVSAYQSAWNLSKQDSHFSEEELAHMAEVYSGMLAESVRNLDQLLVFVRAATLKMSDEERLSEISRLSNQMDGVYRDLQQFNHQNILLSLKRAHDEHDVRSIKNLYGLD